MATPEEDNKMKVIDITSELRKVKKNKQKKMHCPAI
jgi:hypothetical protein